MMFLQCERLIEEITLSRLRERGVTLIKVSIAEAPGQEAQYTRKFVGAHLQLL
jgi:hypothetical protein